MVTVDHHCYDTRMDCSMCRNPEEYKKLFIKKYNYWKIELHSNQCYLGRCIVMLNRHVEDLFEINAGEKNELFKIGAKLNHALHKAFNPNLLNYSSLGNETRHLHLHVIPRYQNPVQFAQVLFTDTQWGHNPSPYNKTFKTSDDTYHKIIDAIRKNLN